MGQKALLCFGEIGWDCLWLLDDLPRGTGDRHLLFEQAMPGGSALNTACVLHALGAKVTLAGNAVGEDVRGRLILEYLDRHGLDSRVLARPGRKTPFCQCLVGQKTGHRDFILEHSDIQKFDGPELGTLPRECLEGRYAHLFVQPYLREASLALLQAIRAASGLWILIQDQDPESEFVPPADAIQISLPEGAEFTPDHLAELAAPYFRGRLCLVLVTNGPHGVGVCEKGRAPHLEAGVRAPAVVDTTGCGDAFRAGLMWALQQGRGLREAVAYGQRVGASKAGVRGSHFLVKPEDLR
jgi:sugar/nucleoside kinase (ribokinase family)